MKIKNIFSKRRKEVIISFAIVGILFLLMLTFRYGNDFYWHLKAGESMVSKHMILKTDIFSWYFTSLHSVWISHEWLFEVLLYGGYLLFGKYVAIIFTFIGLALLFLILYKTNQEGVHKNIYFSIIWLFSSIVLTLQTLPRPFLFSNIFLALTLFLLYDLKKNSESKKIYLVPVIALFWANIHGGSSNLCYLLIFFFYFCGMFHFSLGKITSSAANAKQKKKYLIVFFLSILAVCINPHGIKMLFYPYQNMADAFMIATIGEWQPTDFNHSSSFLYLLLLATTLYPLLTSSKKIDFLDLCLLLCFAFLGFKSIRFWPLVYIVYTYIIFHYVTKKEKRMRLCDRALIASSCLIIVASCLLFKMPDEKLIDEEFIQILKKKSPKRLYNFYDYGGYLIYRDIPVFIDGRADLYSKYNYQDYYNLSMLRGDYNRILKKYDFDYFLLDKGCSLSYYLENSVDYQLILEKENTVLYQKKKDFR